MDKRDVRFPMSPLLISQVISVPYRARIWSSRPEFRRHGALGGVGPRSANECVGERYTEETVMEWRGCDR